MIDRRYTGICAASLTVSAALLLGACGSSDDDKTTTAAGGSPAASNEIAKARGCKDFAGNPGRNQELTFAAGRSNDGVMGKLINETGATMWVRPQSGRGPDKVKECTLAADRSVVFSRDGSITFLMRNEEQDPEEKDWEYATKIDLDDPLASQANASGAYNRSDGYSWKQGFSKGETGTFNWGATKVEIKRDDDNTFDATFRGKTYEENGQRLYYLTSKMSDWAHFTVTVKGLQTPE